MSAETSATAKRGELESKVKYKETILVVDDEALVRSALSEMLAGLGYRCIVAANAIDAMQIVEANLFRLDLLVTDIKMPGELNGLALAELVRARQPETAILLITGHAESPVMLKAARSGYRVLEKPFRHAHLAEAVAEELARRRGEGSVVSLREAREKGRS